MSDTPQSLGERVAGIIVAHQPLSDALLKGRPLLDRIVGTYLEVVGRVVIVGTVDPSVELFSDSRVTIRAAAQVGELASILLGLEALAPLTSGVIIQPLGAAFTNGAMLRSLLEGAGDRIRLLVHEGRLGLPIYAPRSTFEEFEDHAEEGMASVLAHREVELVEWPDPSVLVEISSAEELRGQAEDRH